MNTADRQFRSRAATRQKVEESALRHVRGGGEACNIYRVQGGYEARPLSLGAPNGSHELLGKIEPPEKAPSPSTTAKAQAPKAAAAKAPAKTQAAPKAAEAGQAQSVPGQGT